MKNSRLFQILYLLMERQDLTADILATKLEVSPRTIYRDLDALSAAGIPVYAQKGRRGGVRLMEQFKMERSLLDEEEQEHILTALQSLETVGAVDTKNLLTQLSGLFGKQTVEWLDVDFGSWGAAGKEKGFFEICKQAILKHQLISFEYFNSSGACSRRTVEPLKLCFKGGNWYVSGYCRKRRDYRMFRLSRIYNLKMEAENFLPRRLPEEEQEMFTDMVPVKIEFSSSAAYQVLDFFAPEQIDILPDKRIIVNTEFPPGRWVTCYLLSFGSQARVLEPEWLREQIKEEAEKIYSFY